MSEKIQDLLERLEFNAVLYMQTGENRFFDVVQKSKYEIVEENKRLREALGNITNVELNSLATDVWDEAVQMKRIARKALEGDKQ